MTDPEKQKQQYTVMTKEECQRAIEDYFSEYGQQPPQVDYKDNVVFGRKIPNSNGVFRIKKINNRALSSSNSMELASMSQDGGMLTINFYTADEAMGEDAGDFQQMLDKVQQKSYQQSTIWRECRHKIDSDRAGYTLYYTSASEYLELCYDREKSALREDGFRELLEYKKTKDPACVTEDYEFLLKADWVEFGSDKLSDNEIKMMTRAVDDRYENEIDIDTKQDFIELLKSDWPSKHIYDYDETAYHNLKKIYNTYKINGQEIDVSAYTKPTSVDTMMQDLVPQVELSESDINKKEQDLLGNKDANFVKLIGQNYEEFEEIDWWKYLRDNTYIDRYHVPYDQVKEPFLDKQKYKKAHNEGVRRRKNDLAGHIAASKGYQSRFDELSEDQKGNREQSLQLMRKAAVKDVVSELVLAYFHDNQEQLKKISPELPEEIGNRCRSFNKQNDSMSYTDFKSMCNYVDENLDTFMPNFERDAEIYYNSLKNGNTQPEAEKELSANMRRGHERIVEMRSKLSGGHEIQPLSSYANYPIASMDGAEAIRSKRFEKAVENHAINRRPISAEAMRQQLAKRQAQAGS